MATQTTELIRRSDTWTLRLNDHIDSATIRWMWSTDSSASLLRDLQQARVKKLLIKLSATESIDSLGLRLLLSAQREFSKEQVQIVLQNPNAQLQRLFRIMEFDRVFVISRSD